jgi:thymidylate synthase
METYDLSKGLPIVTTRQIFFKNMIQETFGFIRGSVHIKDLTKAFWGRWAVTEDDVNEMANAIVAEAVKSDPTLTETNRESIRQTMIKDLSTKIGTVGPMYGATWRRFPRVRLDPPWWLESYADVPSDFRESIKEDFLREVALSNGTVVNDQATWERYAFTRYNASGYDQLAMVMKSLKVRPYSSRHRVTALHPDLIGSEGSSPQMNALNDYGALAPCHSGFQFMVTDNDQGEKVLNCMMYMSSSDVPVGRPVNIAQYSILTMLVAHCLDYKPGLFTIVSCDTHIYADQMALVPTQLEREPKPLPRLVINPDQKDLFAMTPADIQIVDYEHHDRVDYPVAV